MALAAGLAAAWLAGPAMAADYRLGPMDKLSIRVVDWQSAQGAFREWPTVTGEYTIGPSGSLSLPFAGEVKAEGRSTKEVAEDITRSIQVRLGLREAPATSVEILEFRPIFVAGEVHTPGKYPFDPEMTVLKAISLAGGMRQSTSFDQRFERDFLNAKGNHDVLNAERQQLLVQLARLEAELGQKEGIDIAEPPAGGPQTDFPALVEKERALMQSRQESLLLNRNALEEAKTLYQNEVSALAKKKETQFRQMDLIKSELDRTGKLANQGLVVSSRVMGLEITAADVESKLLDLDTAAVRAKQEISRLNKDIIELDNDRKTEVLTELQKTQAALRENALKTDMYKGLMMEALTNAPVAASLTGTRPEDLLRYTILRTKNGKTEEISATENTPIQPGDLVKVSLINARS